MTRSVWVVTFGASSEEDEASESDDELDALIVVVITPELVEAIIEMSLDKIIDGFSEFCLDPSVFVYRFLCENRVNKYEAWIHFFFAWNDRIT